MPRGPSKNPKKSNAFCYQPGEMPKGSDSPILSLAQQNQRRADKAAEEITGIKAVYPDALEKASIVHPGSICTVNPVVINDTRRESPFKTAAQVLAHDKDPLDVAGMFKDMDKAETVIKDTLTTQDPAKVLREKRIQLADELMMTYSERTQMEIRDIIRVSKNGEKNAADVFYFGVQALINPPKAPSSSGSAMRRP